MRSITQIVAHYDAAEILMLVASVFFIVAVAFAF
jgi:hypothetical protein